MNVKVTVHPDGRIVSEHEGLNVRCGRGRLEMVVDTQERLTRDALISLGWTPPTPLVSDTFVMPPTAPLYPAAFEGAWTETLERIPGAARSAVAVGWNMAFNHVMAVLCDGNRVLNEVPGADPVIMSRTLDAVVKLVRES